MTGVETTEWAAPDPPFPVEYSPGALEQVRKLTVDAFYSLPRGGIEVGGLLLGRHEQGRVTILSALPVECEHSRGPGYVLSPNDEAVLDQAIASASRPTAGGMIPVGWYHSHTRSEVFLSEQDIEIFDGHFPEPWHVALVVKPIHGLPARAGFFYRDEEGVVHGEASALEFDLAPVAPATARAVSKPAAKAAPRPAPKPAAPAAEAESAPPAPPPEPPPAARLPVVELRTGLPPGRAQQRVVEKRPLKRPGSRQAGDLAALRFWKGLAAALAFLLMLATVGFVVRGTQIKSLGSVLKNEQVRGRELERQVRELRNPPEKP